MVWRMSHSDVFVCMCGVILEGRRNKIINPIIVNFVVILLNTVESYAQGKEKH